MEEGIQSDPSNLEGTPLMEAAEAIQDFYSSTPLVPSGLLADALKKASAFLAKRSIEYQDTVRKIWLT